MEGRAERSRLVRRGCQQWLIYGENGLGSVPEGEPAGWEGWALPTVRSHGLY